MESVTLVGNFTVDVIHVKKRTYRCIGGPPSYGSLVLRDIKDLKVRVFGNYGKPHTDFLNYLVLHGASVKGKKCKNYDMFEIFGIKKKKIFIKKLGCALKEKPEGDLFIFNGVDNEIKPETIELAKNSGGTVFVDPQGFIRKRKVGPVNLYRNLSFIEQLKNVDYIKVNDTELKVISGSGGTEGIRTLHKMGVKNVLYFSGTKIILSGKDIYIKLNVEKSSEIYDGIGMGDIFNAGFVYGLLKHGVEFAVPLAHVATLKRIDRACLLKAPKIDEVEDDAKKLFKQLIIQSQKAI
jgi:hypothetical protein